MQRQINMVLKTWKQKKKKKKKECIHYPIIQDT